MTPDPAARTGAEGAPGSSRVFLVSLSLTLSLAAAELAVRLLGLAPPLPAPYAKFQSAPYLAWGAPPLSRFSGTSPSGEFEFSLVNNSLGFRDSEHSFEKPPGTFRILGLGDSFASGWGAPFEETYLYRLEVALNEHPEVAGNIEVIKAGMGRFFPEPERILLEGLGVRFQPDLVIVGFVANDVVDSCLGLDGVIVDDSGNLRNAAAANLGPVSAWLNEHSHVARMALRVVVAREILARCPTGDAVYQPDGPHGRSWARIEAEFGRMADVTRGIGARLLIVNIPDVPPWSPLHEYPGARLGAWAARNDVDFVDALPAMRATGKGEGDGLYWPIDTHCTPSGYGVIARVLEDHLLERGLLPRVGPSR